MARDHRRHCPVALCGRLVGESLGGVAAVHDEPPALESRDADAAAPAPTQPWCHGPRVCGLVVGTGNGDERRQGKLGSAAQPDVTREPLADAHVRARHVQHVEDAPDVRFGRVVVTVEFVGRFGLDDQLWLVECEADAAIQALVGQREVLEAKVESRRRRDRWH